MHTLPASARRPLLAATLIVLALAGATAAGCGEGSASEDLPARGPVALGASSSTTALEQDYVRVVHAVSPQVVQVQSARGLGSGVVFDGNGNIVTNAHVVAGAREFIVTMSGGDSHSATLVGSDRDHDIAVVHVSGAHPAPATFADSSTLQVGDLALAIGNPLGLRSSVTEGIVSSLRRTVSEGGGVTLSSVIQTSAAINPGNSGGALVDLSGRVIGIPTLAALDPEMGGAQATGIGFAIPSSSVRQIATQLIGN